jgi:hypothetical protein
MDCAMADRESRPTYVRLHGPNFERSVPPDLLVALRLEPSDICRAGTLGFTAMLSEAQRTAAHRHPLVSDMADNPECLAPLDQTSGPPDVPNRYVVRVWDVDRVAGVLDQVDLSAADVKVNGLWFYATVTTEQLDAVRRLADVDFVTPAIMVRPASWRRPAARPPLASRAGCP